MRRGEPLDEFLEWVCTAGESVHIAAELIARNGKWGVASACWQAKLRKIQKDFEQLKVEVSRCVETRDANRLLFSPLTESGEDKPLLNVKHPSPRNNVIPLKRASVRTSVG